jgi:hypothetical protein
MPNTFSMSPGYLRKYIREKKLKKYPFDAFEKIAARIEHLYAQGVAPSRGRGVHDDALSLERHVAKGSAKLIVTSPPYLNVVRYGKFNWIRLWMLRESVQRVDESLSDRTRTNLEVERTDRQLGLSDRLNFRRYCEFLRLSLTECARALRPDGLCVVAIGDVRVGERDRQLALEAWKLIERDRAPHAARRHRRRDRAEHQSQPHLGRHEGPRDALRPCLGARSQGIGRSETTLFAPSRAAHAPRCTAHADGPRRRRARRRGTYRGEEPGEKPTAARRSKRSAGAQKSRSV